MKNINKSLLTAAVVSALALPGLASAASLQYAVNGTQTTYAKDLFVDNTKSIDSPNGLRLTAQAVDNNANRITNIVAGETLTVKLTLGQGAQFDSTYPADTLVQLFLEGAQTGGAGAAIHYVAGTANYNGNELNFKYTTTGAGTIGAAGDYFLQFNSAKIKNLITGLFTGSAVTAQVTVQNGSGQQVLAASTTYARSAWGLTVTSDPTNGFNSSRIDVGADPRKTLFSYYGDVGGSASGYRADVFNAGSITLDVTRAGVVGGGDDYVNNYSAVSSDPNYNVVNTATITVAIQGSDLTPWRSSAGGLWLDSSSLCNGTASGNASISTDGRTATITSNATSALWSSVTNAPPSPSTVYVCFGADNDTEMQGQQLSGTLTVDYKLDQQRVNPDPYAIALLPLQLNGTTITFQNVNPAANPTAQSFLRLTNNTADICPVTIDAKDDAGRHSGEVHLTLGAHASKQVNSEVLEGAASAAGVTGSFGDGTGKWYVRVVAECAGLRASALNRNAIDGTVTNLSPEKGGSYDDWYGLAPRWLTPDQDL